MDAFQLPEGPATAGRTLPLQIVEVAPPRTIGPSAAAEIARFWHRGTKQDVAAEPKQQNAFCLVALVGSDPVGILKLQRAGRSDERIRDLVVRPNYRRQGIGKRLVLYADELVRAATLPGDRIGELVIEVGELDDASHRFLRSAGLRCGMPWVRTNSQREREVYEFRSWRPAVPAWQKLPRFSFDSAGG